MHEIENILHFKHESNQCSRLPNSIIVELSTHKILLKTSMKTMNIICNGVEKLEYLNKTYNIIKLNPNCKVISEDFRIEETKGQLISKCPFGVIVWTKIPTKKFP